MSQEILFFAYAKNKTQKTGFTCNKLRLIYTTDFYFDINVSVFKTNIRGTYELLHIENIYFFEMNTKYVSSNVKKISVFSQVHSESKFWYFQFSEF